MDLHIFRLNKAEITTTLYEPDTSSVLPTSSPRFVLSKLDVKCDYEVWDSGRFCTSKLQAMQFNLL